MKFERSELGALFSKLRTAVPEVLAVGTDDAGILLSGSNAYATNSGTERPCWSVQAG